MKKNKKIKPTTLILYPTKRCNSRCPHCFWVSRSKSCFDTSDAMDMPFDKVKEIIDHYRKKGVKRIRIQSEGEILLYKHFKETVLYCRQRGFLKFGIPTNGILLDEYTDFILDNMNQLTVSIDGYDSKSYIEHRGGTEGTYKKILNNITDFVKKRKNNKCKIMINSVIHSGNFDKSVRFVELAESLGVDAIRFSNFHPIGKEETLKPVSIKDIKHLAKYFSRRKNLIKVKRVLKSDECKTVCIEVMERYSDSVGINEILLECGFQKEDKMKTAVNTIYKKKANE